MQINVSLYSFEEPQEESLFAAFPVSRDFTHSFHCSILKATNSLMLHSLAHLFLTSVRKGFQFYNFQSQNSPRRLLIGLKVSAFHFWTNPTGQGGGGEDLGKGCEWSTFGQRHIPHASLAVKWLFSGSPSGWVGAGRQRQRAPQSPESRGNSGASTSADRIFRTTTGTLA